MKDNDLQAERQRHNDTFKGEAVTHWLNSGKSAEAAGRELGVGWIGESGYVECSGKNQVIKKVNNRFGFAAVQLETG